LPPGVVGADGTYAMTVRDSSTDNTVDITNGDQGP
jgi:hypothetical protein